MLNIISFTAAAAVISSAYAQTYTSCNPLQAQCPADPALGTSYYWNFQTNGASDKYTAVNAPAKITYSSDGADFTISQQGDNPTIQSNFYIMFGRLEVVMKCAPGQGIVSSVILQSDDLDEIDMEWLGGDTGHFQSNYFSKGDTTTYDRSVTHDVASPQTTYHNYTIDWTEDSLNWYLDGGLLRTLASSAPEGYPQTPMVVRVGSWAGGDPSNAPGTIEWAGGLTNYNDGPFVFNVQQLNVIDYSTGSAYEYTNESGSWQSIEAINGQINGNYGQGSSSDPASSSSSSVSSSSATSSSLPASSPAAEQASSSPNADSAPVISTTNSPSPTLSSQPAVAVNPSVSASSATSFSPSFAAPVSSSLIFFASSQDPSTTVAPTSSVIFVPANNDTQLLSSSSASVVATSAINSTTVALQSAVTQVPVPTVNTSSTGIQFEGSANSLFNIKAAAFMTTLSVFAAILLF